ncbi:non-specific lipid-transfer protein 2-like [Rosa rugosa]|uniref:non-specific lipid-transfer protein 2-like n=1 Tax=Rosa rugosa TaxID=74645 RepID=UPI002B40B411|nr:non-specific lipid-transfer protein 2-like [Rosa rugosa]
MKLSTSSGVSVLVLVFIIFMSSATTDLVMVAGGRVPELAHQAAEADTTCDPVQLSPCLDPIQHGSKPSSTCCQKLKEQIPCLCGYIKNPAFKQYVTGPNAEKLSANCGVQYPRC